MGLAAPPEYFCRRQSGQHPGCAVLRSRLKLDRLRLKLRYRMFLQVINKIFIFMTHIFLGGQNKFKTAFCVIVLFISCFDINNFKR